MGRLRKSMGWRYFSVELLKKNIHMDRVRLEAVSQITLEDDVNVPESKPDVGSLNLEKGNVVIDEVKPGTDHVNVRGRLVFSVLYHSGEEGGGLAVLEGKLPFEEKLNMQGVKNSDTVLVDGEVEDLRIGIINSRKLSVQSVVTLNARVEELYDEELPIGVHGEETVEYRKSPVMLAEIAIDKNDIFRIKEEVSLPSNYPNIFQILWNTISLGDVEFKVTEEKINLQGDVHLFLLYEGEGEEHPIRSFETTLPFSGVLECHGSREGMIPDIRYTLGQQEIAIRPDFDGEERNVGLELVLDIAMKLYEEEKVDMVSDLYGVTSEVETVTSRSNLRRLLAKVNGKTKVTDHIRIKNGGAAILQVLHSEASVSLEDREITENGMELSGALQVKVMYITGDDEAPYASAQAQIPYHYTLEIADIAPEDMSRVHADVEQIQVTMLDGEEMDVKAILVFSTTVFQNVPTSLIREVRVSPLDTAKLGGLPGIVVYLVKPGDNLWNIGRKYYVPVDTLRELNNLGADELRPGQKLLIVKGA